MKKIVLGAICLGVLLTGCGGGAKPPAAQEGGKDSAGAPEAGGDKVVNVYNWSDYIDPTVLADLTKKTGIKSNYDVFDSNQVLERKIKERMPEAPVDSLRMIFDPAVVAKFKDCGVSVLDEPTEVMSIVLVYLGKDPRSNSQEDLQAAEKVLLSIRPYLRYIHSSRYI